MSSEAGMERHKGSLLKTVELSLIVVLIILLAAYLFKYGRRSDKNDPASPSVAALADLTLAEVAVGPFHEYLPVEATIQPQSTVYLDAVEGGRVEKAFVEVGSVVKEGDALLHLTNTTLLMDIMWRESELFQQSNNLRNTRLSMEQFQLQLNQQLSELENQIQTQKKLYDRYKELDKDSLISKQDFESVRDQYDYLLKRKDLLTQSQKSELAIRKAQLDALEQSLSRMQGNLDVVKQRQENLTVRAPIDGQITSLQIDVGQTKSPGQRLGQIDVLNGFKAGASIPEDYIGKIEVGRAGEFALDGRTFKLVVKKIFPEVKDGKFGIELEFRGERPKSIKRGQTLHVRIDLGETAKALTIPRGDYLKTTGGDWVYRVDLAKKEAVKVRIKLGRQDADAAEVVKGLAAGDRIIVSSYEAFASRDKLLLKD
jgi:HlyD family secretion protein